MFDALSERGLWESAAVIVCTDHGHYLGEKDIWGKPGVMQYEPLGHIPLLVHWPGVAGGTTCDALTTNVDINATLADVFAVKRARCRARQVAGSPVAWFGDAGAGLGHRRCLRELGAGDRRPPQVRPAGLPATTSPCRCGGTAGRPCPSTASRAATRLPPPDRRARIDFMPGSDVPVIRQPFEPGDRLPFWVGRNTVDAHFLY